MSANTAPTPRSGVKSTALGLIGFPVAGLVAALIDSNEGTDTPPPELYAIAAAHADAIFVSALIFMVSAVLTVPAAVGIVGLVQSRGATLARLGATFLVLGGFGHMGFATWQIMLSRVPDESGRAELTAFLERQQSVMTAVLLPLLLSIVLGVLLLVIALHRAGVVPRWFLVTTIAMVVFDVVLNSSPLEGSKIALVFVWASLAGLFGYLAIRVLRASDVGSMPSTHRDSVAT